MDYKYIQGGWNVMFEDAKFKYEFRPYQKRVLQSVEKHIKDKKVHIVAAPGSRKNNTWT